MLIDLFLGEIGAVWPLRLLPKTPILFASGGQDDAFHVIYARLANNQLLLGQEHPVVSRLLRDHPYALFVCSNTTQDRWHFINVKYEEDSTKRRSFRRITVGPEEQPIPRVICSESFV